MKTEGRQEKPVIKTSDDKKKKKESEDLEIRNLAAWNVPLEEKVVNEESSKSKKKPPPCPRPQSTSPKPFASTSPKNDPNPQPSSKRRCLSAQGNKNRARSASAGRSPQDELRARCWTFLFENLHRAVDEIYQMCEKDESIVESKEAILVLENYTREFRALVEWLTLNKDFENTPPPNRPTSLAWEVRKSLPVKTFLINAFVDKLLSSPNGKESVKHESLSINSFEGLQNDGNKTETEITISVEHAEISLSTKSINQNDESSQNSVILESKVPSSSSDERKNSSDLDAKQSPSLPDESVKSNASNNASNDKVTELKKSSDNLSCDNSEDPVKSNEDSQEHPPAENSDLKEDLSAEISPVDSSGSMATEASSSQNVNTDIVEKAVSVDSAVLTSSSIKADALSNKMIKPAVVKVNASTLTCFPDIPIMPKQKVERAQQTDSDMEESTPSDSLPDLTTPKDQPKVQKIPTKPHEISTSTKRIDKSSPSESTVSTSTSQQTASNKPASSKTGTTVSNATLPRSSPRTASTSASKPSLCGSTASATSPSAKKVSRACLTGNQTSRPVPTGSMGRGTPTPFPPAPPSSLAKKIPRSPVVPSKLSSQAGPPSVGKPQMTKNDKGGSTSSISSTSSAMSWADRVKSATASPNPNLRSSSSLSLKERQASKSNLSGANKEDSPLPARRKLASVDEKTRGSKVQASGLMKTSSSNVKDDKPPVRSQSHQPQAQRSSAAQPADQRPRFRTPVSTSKLVKNKTMAPQKESLQKSASESSKNLSPSNQEPSNDAVSSSKGPDQPVVNSEKARAVAKEDSMGLTNADASSGKKDSPESARSESKTLQADKVAGDDDTSVKKLNEQDESNNMKKMETVTEDDDSDGWEVVRGRTRSRYSPAKKLNAIHPTISVSTPQDSDVDSDWQEQQNDLSNLPWGDRMELELRTPGRALQMHEKLSSPFRKWSPSEAIRRHEEKQAKAQEQRERLLEEKAQKFKDIAKKVEEMKAWKEEQQQQLRITMEKKLQRAEEKRKMQLQKIVRKAHDEEEKVNEIAFINSLEAQNKRHDIMIKEKDHEARLLDLQEERQRKQEEKAAKEAAAEERRKILEAERQARLLEMQERRKLKDMKIEQQLQEKEKERQELANQKARDRELRLSALNAAQQANLEELQKKIQQKQEESARRHEENMEQIRQKAFELSVRRYSSNNDEAPRLIPYETKKMCTLCNVLIGSEVYLLSHLRGKKHQEAVKEQHQGQDPSTEELESYNLKHIIDAPADKLVPEIAFDKERQKALKKRCKKLRQRMNNRGALYEKDFANQSKNTKSQHRQKILKCIKEINTYLADEKISGPWPSNLVHSLDRVLGDLERILEPSDKIDQEAFGILGGINSLNEVLRVILKGTKDIPTVIPNRSLCHTCNVYSVALMGCFENCLYVLNSNKIGNLLEFLIHRLNILMQENNTVSVNSIMVALPTDPVAGSIMKILGIAATCLAENKNKWEGENMVDQVNGTFESFNQKIQDVISYTVSIGIVDKLSMYFHNVRGPIDSEPEVATFLLNSLNFLTALTKVITNRCSKIFEQKKEDDSTQLIATFRVTELVGIVSLLYGMLLHSGAPSRGLSAPPKLPDHTLEVTFMSLRMLNHLAVVDMQMLQSVLGNEGLSLQLRHIASYLLWYCSHWTTQDLLHEVILLVGYFTVLNPDNQMVIQAGQRPTVLQQLCMLPFEYFSDPALCDILFPTLLSCCYGNADNKIIFEQEMSTVMLSKYIEVALLESQEKALLQNQQVKELDDEKARWSLAVRFPKNRWIAAKLFFSEEN